MPSDPKAHPLALPEGFSPDSLDVLPELASILSRLRLPQSTTTLSGATPAGATAAVTGTTPLPTSTPGAGAGAGGTAAAASSSTAPISLKDVPAATDHVRHKLQRARAQIKTLPDMGRTIAEQEEEIRELEAKMARQRAVLVHLKGMGQQFIDEEGGERMEN